MPEAEVATQDVDALATQQKSAPIPVLWSAVTGSFDGPGLRRAIVTRGWTPQEFAVVAGLTSASIYSSLRGHRVRDRTALKVFRALARREPTAVNA
jgi:hypothetical protein